MDQVSPESRVQTGSSSQDLPKKLRKKSPSDRRRDSRRREKFLEEKRNNSPPADSSSSNTLTNPSAETPQETVIVDSPLDNRNTEDMDTVEEVVPVNVPGNKPETIDDLQNLTLPSPVPTSQQIELPLKKSEMSNTTPVHVLICAADKTAALNRSKQFQSSSQLKPHPSDKNHHFSFKTLLDDRSFSKLKTNLNRFEDILMFKIVHETKQFIPDNNKNNHCQECPKYCEEDSDSDSDY